MSEIEVEKKPLKFGGFLLFIGGGVHLSSFITFCFIPFFFFKKYTDSSFFPEISSDFFIILVVVSIFFFTYQFFLLYLFWKKKKFFRTLSIIYFVLIFMLEAFNLVGTIFIEGREMSSTISATLFLPFCITIFFVQYFRKSKRIRETFVY